MVHRLTALILIPLLLASNLAVLMVLAGFELNKEYVVSKLCENRDKPQMNCNGKCYLAKKLKQAEEQEKKQEQDIQKQLLQSSFLAERLLVFFKTELVATINTPYKNFSIQGHDALVFQPPKVKAGCEL